MNKISLRKIKLSDIEYFARWWRDKTLLKLTSGMLRRISDKEVDKFFHKIITGKTDLHFIITLDKIVVGHISLNKRKNGWYETQIVIGDKKYRGKGYGARAIKLLLKKAKDTGINKVYLEVRPNNTRAIKAYEKCGFQIVDLIKHHRNKQLPETLRMELKKKHKI